METSPSRIALGVEAELVEAAARGARDVLERLRQVLQRATSSPSNELDAALIQALARARQPDPLIESLDLPQLTALVDRTVERLRGSDGVAQAERELAWELLDVLRRSALLRRLPEAEIERWADRLLALVELSDFTVGPLFRQRAARYGSRTLFVSPSARGQERLSWRQVALRVETLARGLLSLDPEREPGPVAIVSENRIEMALCDLACLTSGIANVIIPANATPLDVNFMLRHSKTRTVIVSDGAQLRKVLDARDELPDLKSMVSIDPPFIAPGQVLSLEVVRARAEQVPAEELRRRSDAVGIDETASVMYTSGTTGTPKGIRFSHRNIVYKRFARALALPEIGEQDVFLCYLPLFHTFGRFLEMMGCVFWGSTYCMLEDPSVETLVRGMRRHRPTVFISVPRKWIQLHEAIAAQADPLDASDEEQLKAVRDVTGGRLRWGLSAAGHLDSEIFRFFQHHGVELLSGFGMTEATGGITMTPPGDYRDDSLGPALPGIELKLADDGELLVRGPYVMQGYLDPPNGQTTFDDDGWFATGDLMEPDQDGFLRLVDRKKEIYKNIKGETIAPQRIENLFRDFDSVGRAFLVGDHRPYNTVLIYPNPECAELDPDSLDPEALREQFRSVIVSVNRFLAPYERIVDFALIERDLDDERGELTPKGTPRRKVVERSFADVIRTLYQRTSLRVGGVALTIPNWVFQAVGLTAKDVRVEGDRIRIPSLGTAVTVRVEDEERLRIGSCLYELERPSLDLGSLLSSPELWMGNEELVQFLPLDLAEVERHRRQPAALRWAGRAEPSRPDAAHVAEVRRALERPERTLVDLHRAAVLLGADDPLVALEIVAGLREALRDEGHERAEATRVLLRRVALARSSLVRRRALQALAPVERPVRFTRTLRAFLNSQEPVLDEETRASLLERDLPPEKLNAWISMTERACTQKPWLDLPGCSRSLLLLLAEYGSQHPTRYRRLRAFLVRMMLFAEDERIRSDAAEAREAMTRGFRQWLGPGSQVAVDTETGREYRWGDVVVFDEEVDADDRARLLDAFRSTEILREAVFLFSGSVTIRLDDIPPGGVWVRFLGARHGKAVYRVTVQTRFEGSYEVAVNLSRSRPTEELREEVHWLILCGAEEAGAPLVERFGGFWEERGLWTEEFISGETLERALRRLSKRDDDERFRAAWPFLAWTTLAAHVDFWHRTGRRWEIADPDLANVVVPGHDYHTGARIVSVSNRREHAGVGPMLLGMRDNVVRSAEEQHEALRGVVGWDVVCSSLLEIAGEEDGLAMLRQVQADPPPAAAAEMSSALRHYIGGVAQHGFRPMRLYFAIQRYRRWAALTDEPTPKARAQTLQEFWETYGLSNLAAAYPEARVRFFRQTVFQDAPEKLARGLDAMIAGLRRRELAPDEIADSIAELRSGLNPDPDDDYFLARLSFPYLRPEDTATFELAQRAGKRASEMVVVLEDVDGNRYRVRHAMTAKEVGRLHRLFLAAKLDVRFRPEHQFLVALNDRNQIIGGIYYDVDGEAQTAHLEKIVVADAYRKLGVSDGLMTEFENRVRTSGARVVTTGFFRPEYFYAKGFKIGKAYAGLVKELEEQP